jgi:hypothetical protein
MRVCNEVVDLLSESVAVVGYLREGHECHISLRNLALDLRDARIESEGYQALHTAVGVYLSARDAMSIPGNEELALSWAISGLVGLRRAYVKEKL